MWNPNSQVIIHLLPVENPLTLRWGTSNSYPDERAGAGDGSPRFRWGFSSFSALSSFCPMAPLCILLTIAQCCVQCISLCLHHVSAFSTAFTHRMNPSLMGPLLMPPPSNPLPLAPSPRWTFFVDPHCPGFSSLAFRFLSYPSVYLFSSWNSFAAFPVWKMCLLVSTFHTVENSL